MVVTKKIAVLCNYELLPERVGGMDYFFWMFNQKCRENGIAVDWFFPNSATYGEYRKLTIIPSCYQEVAIFFADFIEKNTTDYSTIITHFVEICSPVFKKLKQLSKASVIAVDHNPRPLNGYPLRKKITKKIKGSLYSRYIDTFIGVSDYTVNELISDFGSHIKTKTKTIYNGVLLNDIEVRTKRNTVRPTFIVASHLRESKGIQDLIAAVAILPESVKKELQITIYGDGPYKNELLEQVSVAKIDAVFKFNGSVSNLKELYCQYDYMLQPTHMECFSLSILESLAANVPVITTNVGGNKEAVTSFENGIIFRAKDTKELARIIEKLFDGEIKITTNTRTLIEERFSLEKMIGNYFNLIR